VDKIPKNCRKIVDLVVIKEKSTNGSNTRRTTKLMNQLRDGLGALYDFMDIQTKRRAFS
jgi:hypothetical protein